MMLERLSNYSGQADRQLGTKEINGKKARGFVIDVRKIDPDAHPGAVEIWIDSDSNLPVQLDLEIDEAGVPASLRMEDFRWNVDLDPKLFEPKPPDGYADATQKPAPVDEQIGRITEALRLYAELSGGHYPRVTMIYGDVTSDQMRRMAGFEGQPTPDQRRDKKFKKIRRAGVGLATINCILRDNPDAAYHGRTVGPNDKDKVLLRWKLDNGRFQVIYGDLRSETVTAQRVQELEGR
jgi:hypothetical protein